MQGFLSPADCPPLAPIFVLSKGRAGKPEKDCELLYELNAAIGALERNAKDQEARDALPICVVGPCRLTPG